MVLLDDSYFERNQFVDKILQVIFTKANARRIVISSFDPDVCTLVALKQAKYPVYFLTEGGKHTYKDIRMNTLQAAIQYAKINHLTGIVSWVGAVLKQPEIVQQVHDNGLLLFTYGNENQDPKNVEIQKELKVDAVICDNVQKVRKASVSPKQQATLQGPIVTPFMRMESLSANLVGKE